MLRLFIISVLFVIPRWALSFDSAITLQPHQIIPGEYLLKHPDQKGLLLFHSLGSGKTYIALDYTEKNPEKKVIIVLPEFLKSNWITQMKSFGVKQKSRYELISLNESETLLSRDLKDTIIIVDEVHKLIQKVRSIDSKTSEKMIAVYQKIRSADKILLLTGTPIFEDTTDISYSANLLAEGEPYPVDSVKFRTEYMEIKPVTSLIRGHVTESKLVTLAFPFFITLGAVVTVGTSLPWSLPIVALLGLAAIPVTNEIFPVSQVTFREFKTDKWKDFAEKYISYYRVKLVENENYPNKKVIEKKFLYNDPQANLFLSFVDEDLSLDQLKLFLSEENSSYTDSYLRFHSSRLQKQLLSKSRPGLEIGNLDFTEVDRLGGQVDDKTKAHPVIESPKFLEILATLQSKPGQVAVYSRFFNAGIKKFASFLDRHEFQDQYLVLSPDQTVEIQMETVERYNRAEKRILLIHPEITEGISLVGTEQFHILEPISNSALLEQIIGRAIRYRSHTHLPPDRRTVNVYLWEAMIDYSTLGVPTSAGLLRREHWQKNYSEVNPSMWSKGIVEIDSNYFLKDETPDSRVKRQKSVIQKDIESFERLLENHSIERSAHQNI